MDLGSFASIRAAVKEFESWNVVIDVLINNAAVMAAPYSTTVDGFETQFGVGHLGHFLFTTLLLNAGKIRDGGRIVNVASDGHRFGPVRLDDINFEVCSYLLDTWSARRTANSSNLEWCQVPRVGGIWTSQIRQYSLFPRTSRETQAPEHHQLVSSSRRFVFSQIKIQSCKV